MTFFNTRHQALNTALELAYLHRGLDGKGSLRELSGAIDAVVALLDACPTPQPAPATQQAGEVPHEKLTRKIDLILTDQASDLSPGAIRALQWMRTWVNVPLCLAAPNPPTAQAAPTLAENGHLTQAGHDLLLGATLAGATLVSKGRLVGDTAQAAESVSNLDRDRIREIFMAHGFTVKEGQTDLKQYVYDAAEALLRAARAPADSVLEDAADPLQGAANWLAEAHGQFSPVVLSGCLMIGYNRAKRLHDAALAARKQGGA